MTLGAVVLAAGSSSRLGEPKQLLRTAAGVPLLQHTVTAVRDSGAAPIVVALGAVVTPCLPLCGDATPVIVTDWQLGMAHSLRVALQRLHAEAPTLEGAWIVVCDQPALSATLLIALEDAWRRTGADAAAAEYAGVRGVPALLARSLWPRLLEPATGVDGGARALLRDPTLRIAGVEWPEGSFDVDTPADAARLRAAT
ncbi:MAG: nucleotidyltransferase family protein [Gemmatimonadaceae bacterium]|nr:nucleotidyltransferase family protein [Gemmatimonadaceae bacterium]